MADDDINHAIGDDMENWMSKLPEKLCVDVPLVHLAIPGSRVSASCTIEPGANVAPDFEMVGGSLLKPALFNWAITQNASITQQLNAGIRYLDLRLGSKQKTDNIFVVHNLYGSTIGEILQDVKVFLECHKNEIVILDFRNFYEFTEETHFILRKHVDDIFGKKLCPLPDNLFDQSLGSMRENGHQVIVIYRKVTREEKPVFWPSRAWPFYEPSSTEVDTMLRELERDIVTRPSGATGYISVCAIVPNASFCITNSMSNLKDMCATPCDKLLIPWLKIFRPGHAGFNVMVTDFIDRIPFCKAVVQLNKKLLR